jgi:hypothetical protein
MQRTATGVKCGETGLFLKHQTLFAEFDSQQCEAELLFDADRQIAHPPSFCRGWGVSDMDAPASGSSLATLQALRLPITVATRLQAPYTAGLDSGIHHPAPQPA